MCLPQALTWLLIVSIPGMVTESEVEDVDYLKAIKPVLAERCYACHGSLKQKAGLRVDTAESLIRGGDGGPLVEPGRVDESVLVDVLTGEVGFRMPPEGDPLRPEQIDVIRNWIAAGAPIPSEELPQPDPKDHWSFRPLVRPAVPDVGDANPGGNPIDSFLVAVHQKRGLTPLPRAEASILLRRVSLDLTGLVPSPADRAAFLAAPSQEAYVRFVDRLLSSPQYGERWGRHWMDVWRYSDWDGFGQEVRESQPHIWRWRDWIVESLNADLGYDRMIQAMLAGDEIAPEDPNALRATGFLVRNWYKFNRNIWLDTTVEHTAKAFLGLTMNCARCHDHKYDPIDQADYYRFRAIFEPHEIVTDRVPGQPDIAKDGLVRVYDAHADHPTYFFIRGEESRPVKDRPLEPAVPAMFGSSLAINTVPLPAQAWYPALKDFVRREAIGTARDAVAKARKEVEEARVAGALPTSGAELPSVDSNNSVVITRIQVAERTLASAIADLEAVEAKLRADDARFAAEPNGTDVELETLRAGLAERRAGLARSEADLARATWELAQARTAEKPDEDQTKKVVESAQKRLEEATKARDEAARRQEEPLPTDYTPLLPPRPETSTGRRLALARWITDRDNPLTARVAVNHVWMRHFGTPLVESVFDFGINGKPPSHPELLDWLAAELRDSGWSLKHLHRLIVTSDAYCRQSSVSSDHANAAIDPQNRDLWRMNPRRMESEIIRDNILFIAGNLDLALGGAELDPEAAMTSSRRSLYIRHAKEKRATFLKLFDSPNVTECYRRDISVVPQQALAMANSPLTLAQARRLARALAAELSAPSGSQMELAFVAAAFDRVLQRPPSDAERDICAAFLEAQRSAFTRPESLTPFHAGEACPVEPSDDPAQRARENLVHVLMNHSDFVTIR